MSTRVFYAYLFKENAEFKDLYEARKYLNELREKFVKWASTDMINWTSFIEKDFISRIKQLENDTKNPEKGGVLDYQLQCVIFPREVDGVNYIALQFFPSNHAVKFLKEHVKLREFWYENQTDEGFELPDWELRSKFWDAVYDEYWTPNKAGFVCDIYDGTDFGMSDQMIRNLEELESKQKGTESCSDTN